MNYSVMAKLCEPDYAAEYKYLRTEMAFVERKLTERRPAFLRWVSAPGLGIFRHEDWRKYHHSLDHYGKQLKKYSEEVIAGVLPVKFAVYNAGERADHEVAVRVHVKSGRVDEKRKAPARPDRLDGSGSAWPKLKWPELTGFARTKIKVTAHGVAAELSMLHSHDGAVLVNQLVHVHCEPDTRVTYEVRSRNVKHETGDVDLAAPKPADATS
jgi:hypothetical protein